MQRGLGDVPKRITVTFARLVGFECRFWDKATRRFGPRSQCSYPSSFQVRVRAGDSWRVALRNALRPGRYRVSAGRSGESAHDLVRFRVLR